MVFVQPQKAHKPDPFKSKECSSRNCSTTLYSQSRIRRFVQSVLGVLSNDDSELLVNRAGAGRESSMARRRCVGSVEGSQTR